MIDTLPRYYRDEPTREREVALYIDGHYVTRGPASMGRQAARFGWNAGWGNVVPPERLTWELDRCAWNDRPNLCWGNETLTSEAFLAWLDETR